MLWYAGYRTWTRLGRRSPRDRALARALAAEREAEDLYDAHFVQRLFDEMSPTYGLTNYLSSSGFTERWRRQCTDAVVLRPGMLVVDLMAGMGET